MATAGFTGRQAPAEQDGAEGQEAQRTAAKVAARAAEEEEAEQERRQEAARNFRAEFCLLCGQNDKDCAYRLPSSGLRRGPQIDWLHAFASHPDHEPPQNPGQTLFSSVSLPGGTVAHKIEIRRNEVMFDFNRLQSVDDKLYAAMAMAVAAKANKNLMRNGVRIEGSEEEKLFLTIAAKIVGLRLRDTNPQTLNNADKFIKGQLPLPSGNNVPMLWQNFKAHMASATAPVITPAQAAPAPEPAAAEPEEESPTTDAFNRTVSGCILEGLAQDGISEETYKAVSAHIIRTQDMGVPSLLQTFNEKVTEAQLDMILSAMDAEGLTSLEKNPDGEETRYFNFGSNGQHIANPGGP